METIIKSIETDERVKVVVFDSAIEGFFLTHYDFLANLEETTSLPLGATGLQPPPDMLARLSGAPVVSIASNCGRATGVGSELALASDLRFASREKAILSQWEVGAGLVPGGGPMARLPRSLMGRGRVLEVLLGADDIDGDLAQVYGYVNRSLPDSELDGFVDALAMRIASFDKQAIADTKRLVDLASLPSDAEIEPESTHHVFRFPASGYASKNWQAPRWSLASTSQAMWKHVSAITLASSEINSPQQRLRVALA